MAQSPFLLLARFGEGVFSLFRFFNYDLPFASLLCLIGLFPFSGQAADIKHVFIISFDQGVPWVIQKADMPVFQEMAKNGAHTWEAFTIVPSITLPSHTSMLTGVGIQKHQVTWNDLDPTKGLVKVPTIFSIAKEKGLVTAMYVGKEKFKHLELPHSLDAFVVAPGDTAVAEAFAKDFERLKPNVCFIHFPDPDSTGHKFGVDSPEQLKAFANADAALQIVRSAVQKAGLEDSSVFILTADHGAHNRSDEEIAERTARAGRSRRLIAERCDHSLDRVGKKREAALYDHRSCHPIRHGGNRALAARHPTPRIFLGTSGDDGF